MTERVRLKKLRRSPYFPCIAFSESGTIRPGGPHQLPPAPFFARIPRRKGAFTKGARSAGLSPEGVSPRRKPWEPQNEN